MQQVDDPPSLPVGTEVSAKYKGAFCEAKVSKVVRNIKVKVAYKQGLGSGIVSDDAIKAGPGQLRVGANVEVRHPDRKEPVEATVTKIQDCSQYTVVFDDGDITTLRRTALCLKSGRHFNESETLDQLPLTHPEHFGNPVVGGRRGRRRGQMNDDSSEEEDESDTKEVVNEKEEHIGKVVCIETESKKKDKEKWFPGLVVAPTAQATVRIRVKDEYLVRSFKDFRYYTVPKKEATEFTREAAAKQDGPAVQAALEYLDSDILPLHWDRDALFGLSQNSSSEDEREVDSDSSDDEPREEKDHFVAQLYKYMDDRGTPLNRVPTIQNRDVDLYRLFRAVQKRGGYNRITAQNQWKSIAMRLGFTPVTVCVSNLVKQAYKKFLQPYCEFHRKLGCSMLMTPRNSNRSKGRSLVRANSVASPKLVDNSKETPTTKSNTNSNTNSSTASTQNSPTVVSSTPIATVVAATQSAAEESENTSESSLETHKNKRKSSLTSIGGGKVKVLAEKYEEKSIKDDCDVPLSKMKAAAAAASARAEEKDKDSKDNSSSKDIEEHARDSSPTGAPVSAKREKFPKKSTPQTDDKRGKRKRDEVSVEKVDAGDFVVEIGDKLKVYYDEKKGLVTYEAKVIEISPQRNPSMYLVHYTGWNNRYDEWVPRERIAENLSKGVKQKSRSASAGGTCSSSASTSANADKQRDSTNKQSAIISSASAAGGAGPSGANASNMPSLSAGGVLSSAGNVTAAMKGANLSANKRGRGRSDSLPPRSTTPSSVASNSSRTKSPASSSVKKRPTRNISSTIRRTSANVSDVSIPTESETDSDEPVRRPPRAAKENTYKTNSVASKTAAKRKAQSVSAANSPSDTEDDEDDDEIASTSQSRTLAAAAAGGRAEGGAKGRDYDLNQIRSELKGLQGLKSPSPTGGANGPTAETKDGIKTEHNAEFKVSPGVLAAATVTPKEELKPDIKEETIKSSTDLSSETDSYGDDDSQSSGKTTKLENMTKKLQQKINADKQRALEPIVEKILAEKRQESLKAKPAVIKEEAKSSALAAKSGADVVSAGKSTGSDSAKTTTAPSSDGKDERKSGNSGSAATSAGAANGSTSAEAKSTSTLIAPARFGAALSGTSSMASANSTKYTSVIVEKPLGVCKKAEASGVTKKVAADAVAFKKTTDHLSSGGSGVGGGVGIAGGGGVQTKKFVEPVHKEILKVEPPAACSPSSSSSSSSSSSLSSSTASASASASSSVTITSSSTASTRSLPDMSKLDISGNSSSSSSANTLFTSKATDAGSKAGAHIAASNSGAGGSSSTAITTTAAASTVAKSVSPDIYEFKDPEPFEFEVRKSPMVTGGGGGGAGTSSYASSSCTNSITISTTSSSGGSGSSSNTASGSTAGVSGLRKQNAKLSGTIAASMANTSSSEHGVSSAGAPVANPLATLIGRKKRGSPMKELSTTDKSSKAKKMEEQHKPTAPLVAEAKLTHHPQTHAAPSAATTSALAAPIASGTQSQMKSTGIVFASPLSAAANDSAAAIGGGSSIAFASTAKAKECASDAKIAGGGGNFSVFDVLRKTPSSNLNINALNEELAQTVQETTRALTDAQQPGETTPTKVDLKSPLLTASGRASPKAPSTPTANTAAATNTKLPVTVGSPFIETRKDLSNVFELSFGEGLSGSGEPRENRFELENAKILLSATTAGFDLMPAKLEHSNKPTSIADKVLKAISQKKEEVENKHKEREAKLEIEKSATTDIIIGVSGGSAAAMPSEVGMGVGVGVGVSVVTLTDVPKSGAVLASGALLDKRSHELNIVTPELDGKSRIGAGVTSAFAKPTASSSSASSLLSGSPESKVGILESISAKNNDLSETIQKLECAIQRKTPVPSLSAAANVTPLLAAGSSNATTPVAAVASVNYSDDDSMDSTDSERPLVIEDADDTTGASPTVAVGGAAGGGGGGGGDAKTISASKQTPQQKLAMPSGVAATAAAGGSLQAPIPLKVIAGGRGGGGAAAYAVPPSIVGKLPNSPVLLATGKDVSQGQQQQQQLHLSPVGHQTTSVIQGGHVMSVMPLEVKRDDSALPMTASAGAIKLISPKLSSHRQQQQQQSGQQMHGDTQAPNQQQQQQQRSVVNTTVVPILVPDIPVSVVVAPHATPNAKQLQSLNVKSIVHTSGAMGGGALVMTSAPAAPLTVGPQGPKGFELGVSGSGSGGGGAVTRGTQVQASGCAPVATSKANITATAHHTGSADSTALASGSSSGSSGFYLQSRADLRPDDGVKPIGDVRNSSAAAAAAVAGITCFADALDTGTAAGHDFGSAGSSGGVGAGGSGSGSNNVMTITLANEAPANDSAISLLCEETIPGSPAPATSSSRDDATAPRVGAKQAVPSEGGENKATITTTTTTATTADTNAAGHLLANTVISSSSGSGIDAASSVIGAGSSGGGGGGGIMNPISSPNDSASQDDSGDELHKKCLDVESEVSPRKRRRRTRKQSEIVAALPEQQLQPTKRRRPIVCNKKNTTAGSESDDNSDAISQRSAVSGRQQQQQLVQLQTQTTSASGIRPCPYNFLVQLNPSLGSEQCIAILLKQIQELRKTYNMIKSDLAGIDRRRKKLRRREREKKQQQMQNQQQIKIGT